MLGPEPCLGELPLGCTLLLGSLLSPTSLLLSLCHSAAFLYLLITRRCV